MSKKEYLPRSFVTQISALRRAACLVGRKYSGPSGKARKQLVGSVCHCGQGPASRAVWHGFDSSERFSFQQLGTDIFSLHRRHCQPTHLHPPVAHTADTQIQQTQHPLHTCTHTPWAQEHMQTHRHTLPHVDRQRHRQSSPVSPE